MGERKRIGGEFVQRRISEPQWRLHFAPLLLLAKDVGDVIGAERPCGVRFGESGGDGLRTVFTDESEQFADLPGQRAIGIGEPLQIFVRGWAEQRDEALLRSRAFRGGHLSVQLFLKTLRAEGLSALPRPGITDDLVMLVVDDDRGSVGLHGELRADITRRYAVPVAIERQTQIFVHERFGDIPVIGDHCRQGPERFGTETFVRRLAGFAMPALIGAPLAPNTTFTLTIQGVKSTAGFAMTAPVIVVFTTGPGATLLGPTVTGTNLLNGATAVPVSITPTVTFSTPINSLTTYGYIVLRLSSTNAVVPSTLSFSADYRTVTITPNSPLSAATQYNVYLGGSNITDQAGYPNQTGVSTYNFTIQ